MLYNKLAIAMQADTAQELHELDAGIHALLLDREQNKRVKIVDTPDDKYVIYFWDFESIDTTTYVKILEFLEHRRHAIVEIKEDGVWTDIEDTDEYGTDEEFNEILGWRADIVLWNDPDDVIV